MEFKVSSSPTSGRNAKVKVLLKYVGYIVVSIGLTVAPEKQNKV